LGEILTRSQGVGKRGEKDPLLVRLRGKRFENPDEILQDIGVRPAASFAKNPGKRDREILFSGLAQSGKHLPQRYVI
jgi:hypothetical protein